MAVVVILAAIWLAWQGLIRKRATRTIEGTIWMIAACAAAIFLIGKPADVTGLGRGVSNGASQALNAAFAKLPSPGVTSCVPLQNGDPQVRPATYSYTSGSTVVDQNADELWTVLVCKPWLVGEFGTSEYTIGGGRPTAVNTYGRALLWSQAIAVNERATPAVIQAKQDAYAGIATSIQTTDPADYPLFQGKQWTTRLEVAFAALFAAVVAGVLVLLLSVTLILLKLSFLLLLIVGPFFLLIGAHPGFGRVVALRWIELLIGVLLKQAALALVLSVLLYCYTLIMGASDAVLPWALKILMIALVTIAAFIYRKPFQHLFSAVGYGVIGSQDRAELDLARAGATARANTLAAATVAPGFAAYRAARWARRNPGRAASLAMAAASGGTGAAVAAGLQAGESVSGAAGDAAASDGASGVPGALPSGTVAGGTHGGDGTGRLAVAARARAAATAATPATEPPPLNLPARNGSAVGGGAVGGVGWRRRPGCRRQWQVRREPRRSSGRTAWSLARWPRCGSVHSGIAPRARNCGSPVGRWIRSPGRKPGGPAAASASAGAGAGPAGAAGPPHFRPAPAIRAATIRAPAIRAAASAAAGRAAAAVTTSACFTAAEAPGERAPVSTGAAARAGSIGAVARSAVARAAGAYASRTGAPGALLATPDAPEVDAMDISPAARRVIFGLTVCALVGLGVYLIGPAALGARGGSGRNHGSLPTAAVRRASGTANSVTVRPAGYLPVAAFHADGTRGRGCGRSQVRRRVRQLFVHRGRGRLQRADGADHVRATG